MHDVLRVLGERTRSGSQPGQRDDGYRVALAIEGGGMRGTISAGMAFALDELGLVPAFDAVYGASAGAITGAWLLSRPAGLRGWTEPASPPCWPARSNSTRWPPTPPPASPPTCAGSRPPPAELRLALRASAALPLLAGPPVALGGRRFYDAGLSEPAPYRTALEQGATHVLFLRSRRDPVIVPDSTPPPVRPAARPVRPACSPAPPRAARPRPCAPPSWPATPAEPPTTNA